MNDTKITDALCLDYIRETYGVPAEIGRRVKYGATLGTIVGTDGVYLRIKLDGWNDVGNFHPTWNIDYLDGEGDRT